MSHTHRLVLGEWCQPSNNRTQRSWWLITVIQQLNNLGTSRASSLSNRYAAHRAMGCTLRSATVRAKRIQDGLRGMSDLADIPDESNGRVFISHASGDRALADHLVSALEELRVPCWVAPRDVIPGEEYPVALAKAIDECEVFLILFSTAADSSTQVSNEIERAASRSKPILLVRIDETDPGSNSRTGFFLTRHHWFDATKGNFEDHLPTIASAARQAVERHRSLPTGPSAEERSDDHLGEKASRKTPSAHRSIGVEIGATKVRACVLDLEISDDSALHDIPMYFEALEGTINARTIIKQVEKLVAKVMEEHFKDTMPVGLGVAAPGQIDMRAGTLKFGPNLFHARNIPFKTSLSSSFPGVPVRVDNEVRCHTRCELHFGVGNDFDSFACISVGTGVGSGMVIDRQVYFGHNFCAGEIGHMKIASSGSPCSCGQIGCLESFIKAQAIVDRAVAKGVEWETRGLKTLLTDLEGDLTPEAIVAAIEEGDDAAQEIANDAAIYFGLGIANYLNLFNPAAVVISGGVMSGFFFPMIDQITDTVQRNALAEVNNTPIVQSGHPIDGIVIGAALLFHPDDVWPV